MKAVIILAAGHGTRMKSTLPKVLHTVSGKPMLHWVLEAVSAINPDQIIVVSSPALAENPLLKQVDIAVQSDPKGTGDALKIGFSKIKSEITRVFLVCADMPLLHKSEIAQLAHHQEKDLIVMGMHIDDTKKTYGRIECTANGDPLRIMETKHNDNAKYITLANTGVYSFNRKLLDALLPKLSTDKASGEIFATDLIELATQNGFSTGLVIGQEKHFLGVNTPADLHDAENLMQQRLREHFIDQGVKFHDASTCFFHHDTQIAPGSEIEPHVIFGKNVVIKEGATIHSFCYLNDCVIEENATVGPFAHLRGNTTICAQASIGNFVEVKASTISKGSKAKHLSYIGDAFVGEKSNIGAGTITCNYNGFKKFKTIIGNQVMIGANSTLVAPVTIEDNAYIAAGSVIVKNVTKNSLAITRTEQKEKPNWTITFRAKYQ